MPISIHIIKINKKQRLTKAQDFASPVAVVLPICCTIMCLFSKNGRLSSLRNCHFPTRGFFVYTENRENQGDKFCKGDSKPKPIQLEKGGHQENPQQNKNKGA